MFISKKLGAIFETIMKVKNQLMIMTEQMTTCVLEDSIHVCHDPYNSMKNEIFLRICMYH